MQTFRETDGSLVGRIAALQDKSSFKELHWEGSFEEYLKIVRENPRHRCGARAQRSAISTRTGPSP